MPPLPTKPPIPPTPAAMFIWTLILIFLAATVVAMGVAFYLAHKTPPSELAPSVQHMATTFFALATALTLSRAAVKLFSKS